MYRNSQKKEYMRGKKIHSQKSLGVNLHHFAIATYQNEGANKVQLYIQLGFQKKSLPAQWFFDLKVNTSVK